MTLADALQALRDREMKAMNDESMMARIAELEKMVDASMNRYECWNCGTRYERFQTEEQTCPACEKEPIDYRAKYREAQAQIKELRDALIKSTNEIGRITVIMKYLDEQGVVADEYEDLMNLMIDVIDPAINKSAPKTEPTPPSLSGGTMITDYTMASKSNWRNAIGARLFWLGTNVTAIGWHFYRSEMRRTYITQRIARTWFHIGREIEALALRIAG